MAEPFSPHRSFPEGHQPSAAAAEMLAEHSGTGMGSPRKKHAFGPLLALSRESEQFDLGTQDPLSLESEDESGKYMLCSTRPGVDLWKYVPLPWIPNIISVYPDHALCPQSRITTLGPGRNPPLS